MAGLDPAIHVFSSRENQDVDARDKRGHDEPLGVVGEPTKRDYAASGYRMR